MSVLGAGGEASSLNLVDLDLKRNFSLRNAAVHATTMTSFAFEEAAKRYPKTSFIHAFPGMVKTGGFKEGGPLMKLGGKITFTLLSPFTVDVTESGERHLYAATSGVFPAKESDGGVEIGAEQVRKGSDGEIGSGAYLIGWTGEVRANEKAMTELRKKGAGPKIWEHTQALFQSVRAGTS